LVGPGDWHHVISQSPGLTEAAVSWLVAQRPKCLARFPCRPSHARWTADQFVVHRRILEAGIPIVEGVVHLGQLPPRVQFFAPFYKFAGIDSAPARAFAVI
jgi:kynurenine formamidase